MKQHLLLATFLFSIFISKDISAQSTGYIKIPEPGTNAYIYKAKATSTNHFITVGTGGLGAINHEIIYWDINLDPVWSLNFPSAVVMGWIDVIETNDGNFIAFGYNQNHTGCNIAIKINPAGTVLWQKEYYINATFLSSFSVSKAAGNDPGFVFGGGACAASAFLVRCDANGDIVWQNEYYLIGMSGVETTETIIAENDSYILGGNALNGAANDAWITKVDSTGTWIFTNVVNEPIYNQIPYRMVKLSTGNYAMVCQYNSNPNYAQLVYYFGPTGNVIQASKFVHPLQSEIMFYDLTESTAGKVIIVGAVNDNSTIKYLYMELSATGAVNWQKKATGVTAGYLNGTAYAVTKTPSGNYSIFGAAYTDQRSIAVIDGSGTGYCNGVAENIPVSAADAYTVTANTPAIFPPNILAISVNNTYTSLTLTTTNMCGTIGTNDLANASTAISVFPNPGSDVITISFGETVVTTAEIVFYNILGEEVYSSSLANTNSSTIDISKFASGIYMMEVNLNGEKIIRKVIKN